jgi:hypothetical protein
MAQVRLCELAERYSLQQRANLPTPKSMILEPPRSNIEARLGPTGETAVPAPPQGLICAAPGGCLPPGGVAGGGSMGTTGRL